MIDVPEEAQDDRRIFQKHRARAGALIGLLGGAAGGVLMITYAMLVSFAYKDVGFFTPLCHIGATFAEPDAMMASMEAAMAGDGVLFDAGPAALGLLVHLLTGAVAGAIFGALLSLVAVTRLLTTDRRHAVGGRLGHLLRRARQLRAGARARRGGLGCQARPCPP